MLQQMDILVWSDNEWIDAYLKNSTVYVKGQVINLDKATLDIEAPTIVSIRSVDLLMSVRVKFKSI